MEPKKPTFIIIGSAKCGTTALASILGAHPDCCMSNPKEVNFFQDSIDYQTNPNYEKGWEWYRQAFAHYNGEPVVGEATPSYSDRRRSPNTAKRIYEPDLSDETKAEFINHVKPDAENFLKQWGRPSGYWLLALNKL